MLHYPKAGDDDPGSTQPERIDALEYVARVLAQIPPPRKHLVLVRYPDPNCDAGVTSRFATLRSSTRLPGLRKERIR